MPDEQSNLNSPRRPAAGAVRRRGRRGGRGRARTSGPRPPAEKAPGEISPASESDETPEAPETGEETAAPAGDVETHEPEPDNSGGFRTPHAEVPEEFASHPTAAEEIPHAEPAAEAAPGPSRAPEPRREERRDDRRDDRREDRRDDRREPRHDDRRDNRPPPRVAPAQRQWTRPADFRPAEDSAIHEAVAHATFIASALKELHDQMDEILELVEVAERQKLVDERELDELRRALRRIQPNNRPQQQQSPRHQPRREESRREEPRREEPRPAPPEEQPPAD